MKKIFSKLMMLLCAATALVGCDESGDKIYLDGFKASELMASASDVSLSVDKSKSIVLSMAWNNPTLLSSDETMPAGNGTLATTLQASASTDFATVKEYSVTTLSKAFTGADLNALAKELGLIPDASAPVYFRIKSQMGANLNAAFSNVCQVNVTPYLIDMSYINILNSNKDAVLTYLYSPEKNGVYTGYMNVSSWLNFYARENDGTMWGNSATVSFSATGAEYNKSTGDKGEPVAKTLNYSFADGVMTAADQAGSLTIATAGTYTVTVKVGADSQLTYTIVAGDQTSPEPVAKNTLCMFTPDGGSLLAIMTRVSDGVYTCKYKPSAWENFRFIYVGESKDDQQANYGSDPSDLFKLSTADGNWNIWFKDDVNGNEVTVTADLNAMTWKYE